MTAFTKNFPSTPLGELTLIEPILWYDGPQAAVYQSSTDQFYVNVHSFEDDTVDVWLYVPVSVSRLSTILRGEMEWRDVFARPETVLYVVSWVDETPTVVQTDPVELPEQWLPTPGVKLKAHNPDGMDVEEAEVWNEWVVSTQGSGTAKDAFLAGRASLRVEASLARNVKYVLNEVENDSSCADTTVVVQKLLFLASKMSEPHLISWEKSGVPENWDEK